MMAVATSHAALIGSTNAFREREQCAEPESELLTHRRGGLESSAAVAFQPWRVHPRLRATNGPRPYGRGPDEQRKGVAQPACHQGANVRLRHSVANAVTPVVSKLWLRPADRTTYRLNVRALKDRETPAIRSPSPRHCTPAKRR